MGEWIDDMVVARLGGLELVGELTADIEAEAEGTGEEDREEERTDRAVVVVLALLFLAEV